MGNTCNPCLENRCNSCNKETGEINPAVRFELDGKELKLCPLKSLTPRVRRMLDVYAHYKNGFLPCGGGVLQQPHKYMQGIRILSTIEHDENKSKNKAKQTIKNKPDERSIGIKR